MSKGRIEAERCFAIADPYLQRVAERAAFQNLTGTQYAEFLDAYGEFVANEPPRFVVDDHLTPDERAARRERENRSPFAIIEAGEFAGGAYVEPEWLIEELIPVQGIGLAWGLSGSFKTCGIFDLMAATHRGVGWRDKAVKRGRSIMVVAEGEYFFPNRMRAYAQDRGIDVSELPAVVPRAVDLRSSKDVAALAHELLKLGAAQIWFDTLQQCAPSADENSVKDMGEVITNLKWLSRKLGCFAGVIHHAGKNIDKGARGSSAWRPAVDVELYFEADDTRGIMRAEKIKDGPRGRQYPFENRVVEIGRRSNGKPITSPVIAQVNEAPVMKRDKLPKAGTALRNAYDVAASAIRDGVAEEDDVIAGIADTKREPAAGEIDRRVSRATDEVKRLVLQGHLRRNGRLLRLPSQLITGCDEEWLCENKTSS